MLDKKQMSEEDIKRRFITPALHDAGWKDHIVMEYSFTDGRIIVNGDVARRGKRKSADYLLFYNRNLPLAVVEAKANDKSPEYGLQQALEYARILDVPFVYSSNGDCFIEHDKLLGKETEIPLDKFPTREALWKRYVAAKGFTPEQEDIVTTPYYFQRGDKVPRYYQRIAINKTVEAIAKGQNRILLVMATGTGKTYTAFQIIHRLWKKGVKKKILFLADRNILVDQTMMQDFKPFSKVMTKVEGRKLDSSYEVYLALYQQLAGEEGEEPFREFEPEFFDLIVIDECHRGSAKEASQWRRILDYFSSATQIGMTATPKETKDVSNITYFGEPVYTYSLKEGIEDGFLAPYKVIRVNLDIDIEGFRPQKDQVDQKGEVIEDREYGTKDYDKRLVIEERTKTVAQRVTEYLKRHDRYAKSIIFCVDIDHAERMRQELVNLNSDLMKLDDRYVMKITGDDQAGKAQLDNFIDVHSRYPVVVTTSKLLTTGVDCKTCKVIVLDTHIESMTEFKQIVGRGTRVNEEHDKLFFTIIDFRGATKNFFDPAFDGEPIVELVSKNKLPPEPKKEDPQENPGEAVPNPECEEHLAKYRIKGNKVNVVLETVSYLGPDGRPIISKLIDYTKKNILGEYATLDDFIQHWNSTERKKAIVEELEKQNILLDVLRDHMKFHDMDDFDLICHIAYDKKPLTRAERVRMAKQNGLMEQYSEKARKVLDALLQKYMENGVEELESMETLKNDPFRNYGSPMNIAQLFGGKAGYLQMIRQLESQIYVA